MTLVCLLDDAPEGAPRLYGTAADGGVVPIDAAAAAEAPGPVVAVVPGTAVLLRTVALPVKSEAQARTAAAFALEDELAAEPENLHFALGPRQTDGERAVAVIAAATMAGWLARLRAIGVAADIMVPDFLALTGEPPLAVRFDGRAILRDAVRGGFAIEEDLLDAVVPDHACQALPPRAIDAATLAHEAAAVAAAPPLNLLQGPYRPRREGPGWLALGRRAAALAAVSLLLWLGLTLADAWRLKALDDHYYQAARETARAALPDGTRLIDPVRQLRRAQAATRGADGASQDGFLPLAALLIEALAAVPSAEVQSLRYGAEQDRLSAEIAYGAFADLESLDNAVRAAGGTLTERGARQEGGRVVGRVELSRAVQGAR